MREARPTAAPTLLAAMRAAGERGDVGLVWVIGAALGVVADDSCYDEVQQLAEDRSLGRGREVLVMEALGRMKNREATEVLLRLLDDEDVSGHAVAGLAMRADPRARDALERFAQDGRPWVRREAAKGLKRLGG